MSVRVNKISHIPKILIAIYVGRERRSPKILLFAFQIIAKLKIYPYVTWKKKIFYELNGIGKNLSGQQIFSRLKKPL